MAAEPFALPIYFVACCFECVGSIGEGGAEIGRGRHFSEFALDADVGAAAVRLDDRNAFCDTPGIGGELFVFVGCAPAWKGAELGGGGRLIAASVADGVEEAIVVTLSRACCSALRFAGVA